MQNNQVNYITLLISLVLAIATVALAVNGYYSAKQAESIATQANELVYKSNLPSISATRNIDWVDGKATDKITVQNVGRAFGPPYDANLYAYLEIKRGDVESTYLNIYDYYGDIGSQKTGNSYDLILVGTRENNYSSFLQVQIDFSKAASKYSQSPTVSIIPILGVSYVDFMGKSINDSYKFVGNRLEYIKLEDASKIINAAYSNNQLASFGDVNLSITRLDGTKIWEWYKNQILIPSVK